ncbi:MAG: glycoside hydrolase family 10 protein [bacterium]
MKRKLISWLSLTLILSSIFGCLYGTTQIHPALSTQELRGIWIRLPNNEPEIDRILDDISRAKFNAAFIETFYHGYTIYPSSVFPERPELDKQDLLNLFIKKAHQRHIQVHCWIEVFYWRPTPDTNFPQTPVLDKHPEWLDLDINGKTTEGFESKHYLVNPSVPGVRQKIIELVQELCTKYPIDGINLDYIRYAAGNTEFGYNPYAIDKFKKRYGYDPKSINSKTEPDKWQTWAMFREQQVTELVALIAKTVKQSKKPVKLSAAVFPDYYQHRYTDSRLQDWATWCETRYLDFLTPMCYSPSIEGIKKEISVSQSGSGQVPVYPGLAGLAGSNHPALPLQIQAAREIGCKGEVIFCYSWMTTMPNIFTEIGNLK